MFFSKSIRIDDLAFLYYGLVLQLSGNLAPKDEPILLLSLGLKKKTTKLTKNAKFWFFLPELRLALCKDQRRCLPFPPAIPPMDPSAAPVIPSRYLASSCSRRKNSSDLRGCPPGGSPEKIQGFSQCLRPLFRSINAIAWGFGALERSYQLCLPGDFGLDCLLGFY